MEQLRIFERKCFRACLNKYRTPESNYQKYISNKKIYDMAKISRIDNFIIKQTRNYFASSTSTENSLIYPIVYTDPNYIERAQYTGHIPPEGFIFLDSKGYIQDRNMVPIIYHIL